MQCPCWDTTTLLLLSFMKVAMGTMAFFMSLTTTSVQKQVLFLQNSLASTMWGDIYVCFCKPNWNSIKDLSNDMGADVCKLQGKAATVLAARASDT